MIDFSVSSIKLVATSWVGNKNRYEGYKVPDTAVTEVNELTEELLIGLFSKQFRKDPEFFQVRGEDVSAVLTGTFDGAFGDKHAANVLINELTSNLYEHCDDPRVHGGDFIVVQFDNVYLDGNPCQAIGLWKVESKVPFFQTNKAVGTLSTMEGIEQDRPTVAALVFWTGETLTAQCVDKVSKAGEWSFWKDGFLGLYPENDNYFQTRHYTALVSDFIREKAAPTLTRPQTNHLLLKAKAYFEDAEEFDLDAFTGLVMPEHLQEKFKKYVEEYASAYNVMLYSTFVVSSDAVKKANRMFKTGIKLDDRFQITTNSRWDLVEFGKEDDGRKFYKIYFDYEA